MNPVAFSLFGISVHWYGIMYVLALLIALWVAKYFVKKDKIPISNSLLDNYFFWVEIGVILGARLGYIIIYDPNTLYYLTQPWQIFNPFINSICTDKHNQYPKYSNNSIHIIPPILKILYNNIRLKVIKKRRTFVLLFLFVQSHLCSYGVPFQLIPTT